LLLDAFGHAWAMGDPSAAGAPWLQLQGVRVYAVENSGSFDTFSQIWDLIDPKSKDNQSLGVPKEFGDNPGGSVQCC